jgi:hypothetical protein
MTKNFVLPRKEKRREFWDDEMDRTPPGAKGKSSRVLFPIPVKKGKKNSHLLISSRVGAIVSK